MTSVRIGVELWRNENVVILNENCFSTLKRGKKVGVIHNTWPAELNHAEDKISLVICGSLFRCEIPLEHEGTAGLCFQLPAILFKDYVGIMVQIDRTNN